VSLKTLEIIDSGKTARHSGVCMHLWGYSGLNRGERVTWIGSHNVCPIMNCSTRLRASSRIKVWAWLLVALLLLQGALPAVAVWAAASRGVALVEVCSVYGVRTVAVGIDASGLAGARDDAPPGGEAHSQGEPCALAFLLANPLLELPPVAAWLPGLTAPATHVPNSLQHALPFDARLRWLAMRHHAPPSLI
jgi:hypothetical protein